MSAINENTTTSIPDASGKLDEDKYGFESTTDSGFISGEIYSGDNLTSEEVLAPLEEPIDDSGMRVDSGIVDCLSDNFSSLSLKHGNLNDLSSSKIRPISPTPVVSQTAPTPPVQEKSEDSIPWMMYYEQDEDGDTHLHLAIVQGYMEVVLALIRMAPMQLLLDTPNDDKHTPLHLAVITRHPRVVRWLIVAGARPDPRGPNGDSPLHIAARNGDIDCCRAIIEPVQSHEKDMLALSFPPHSYPKCCLDQWNNIGQTCVHVAAENSQVEVLKYLVWYGADVNAREGLRGFTALHYAIWKGDERIAQFLLSECRKLHPETVSYDGKSVLQVNPKLSETLVQILRSRGVPSPYSSDDSEDEFDQEEEREVAMMPSQVQVA